MTFHPEHMHAGIRAAIASPKTPQHLKQHLAKRLEGVAMKPMIGANPKKNVASASKPIKGIAAPKMVANKKPQKKANPAKPLMPPEFYGTRA